MPLTEKDGVIKHGGFTWVRDDQGDCECWDVRLPERAGLPYFCVKNYGGTPSDSSGFTGWRVVGGGPFTDAGGWTSRDAAIKGAAPWLRKYYRSCIRQKIVEARRTKALLEKFFKEIDKQG